MFFLILVMIFETTELIFSKKLFGNSPLNDLIMVILYNFPNSYEK